jgi:hypothetical protein
MNSRIKKVKILSKYKFIPAPYLCSNKCTMPLSLNIITILIQWQAQEHQLGDKKFTAFDTNL